MEFQSDTFLVAVRQHQGDKEKRSIGVWDEIGFSLRSWASMLMKPREQR